MIWGKYRSSNHMHQLNLNNTNDLDTLKQFRIAVKSHNKEVREGKKSGPQVYIKLCGRGPRREAEKIDGVKGSVAASTFGSDPADQETVDAAISDASDRISGADRDSEASDAE